MAVREISTYQRGVRRRIRNIREAMGWTQQEMASALGIPLETYRKYELRSMMPLHVILRFAQITHHSLDYIISGQYQSPIAEPGLPTRRAQ
jgi:transcriptional regulator with XRE-family HTH domain